MAKIRLIVIDEHTLGYELPETNNAGILHASVLRGSPYSNMQLVHLCNHKNIRLASEKDFDDFNVSFKGFDNPNEYDYVTE